MDAVPFSAHNVNTRISAIDGSFVLPDGSKVTWGLSRREFGPMSFKDRPEWDVAHNRMQFLRLFDLKIDDVISPHLQHTATVIPVTAKDARKGARELSSVPGIGDALATSDAGIVLLTTHADCMPVWLCAPASGWIGIAHVGRRGLLRGILVNLVDTIPETERDGITLAIGPGICREHYDVSTEIAKEFRSDKLLSSIVIENENRFYLDLRRGVELQAQAAGVRVPAVHDRGVRTLLVEDGGRVLLDLSLIHI